jgi:hypothetical protein
VEALGKASKPSAAGLQEIRGGASPLARRSKAPKSSNVRICWALLGLFGGLGSGRPGESTRFGPGLRVSREKVRPLVVRKRNRWDDISRDVRFEHLTIRCRSSAFSFTLRGCRR